MKVAIATRNAGKLEEFIELASGTPYEFIKIPDRIKDLPPETGKSFYQNALIKAEFVSKELGIPAIGDDSGLEVDALNGEPGIFSARYSESGTDIDNCKKLLQELAGVNEKQRTARFKCCLVGYFEGEIIKSFGCLEGNIATNFKGKNGFGYDPIFITRDGLHLAELDQREKNHISHRSSAFKLLLENINRLFN